MKSPLLPFALTMVLALIAGFGFLRAWQLQSNSQGAAPLAVAGADNAQPKTPLEPIDEFTLTERSGNDFDSSTMRGQVWAVSFFFSSCPGSCYQLNQALASVHKDPAFADARFLSITCDPDTDTEAVLSAYADRFAADAEGWLFCRGDLNYVKRIGTEKYELTVAKQTHSDRAIIVDAQGKTRGAFIMTDANQLAMFKRVFATCLSEAAAQNTTTPSATDSVQETKQ